MEFHREKSHRPLQTCSRPKCPHVNTPPTVSRSPTLSVQVNAIIHLRSQKHSGRRTSHDEQQLCSNTVFWVCLYSQAGAIRYAWVCAWKVCNTLPKKGYYLWKGREIRGAEYSFVCYIFNYIVSILVKYTLFDLFYFSVYKSHICIWFDLILFYVAQ